MAHDNPTTPMQFCDALRCLGRVKTLLALLILLCLLVQITGFILVNFAGVIDKSSKLPSAMASRQNDAGENAADTLAAADVWYDIVTWSLAVTKFVALVLAGLLMLTVMFSVKVSLVGRVGATAGFLGAFFWSLILLAILVPWQQILGSGLASGATFNLAQLIRLGKQIHVSWGFDEATANVLEHGIYYARFLAFPCLTLLVLLLVCLKFSRGYRPLVLASFQGAAHAGNDDSPPVRPANEI